MEFRIFIEKESVMHLLVILLITIFSIFDGRPAKNAEIYLEKGNQLIGFRVTGEKGKAEFNHLDAGSYRILIVFPQQEGKYTKDNPRYRSLTKASFNPRNKTYYYQGSEGYFAIRFSGISNIKSENFVAAFKEEKEEDGIYILVATVGAHKNNAGIGIRIKSVTQSQFYKATQKEGTNLSMISIPTIR